MILTDHVLTLEGYKVRLFCGLNRIAHTLHVADVFDRRTRLGGVTEGPVVERWAPILDDGEIRVRGAEAILFYLALRHAPSWLPIEPVRSAAVVEWLSFACLSLGHASTARTRRLFEGDAGSRTLELTTAAAERAYRRLDDHLVERELTGAMWLVGDRPSIADVACFPAVALADDAGLSLDRFHGLNRWVARLSELPGFVTMPGVFALSGMVA